MVKIIEISYNRSFCRLRLDNGEEYWIRDKDLSFMGFQEGKEYSRDSFMQQIRICQYPHALNHAVSMLARRPCSTKEILSRLLRLRYAEDVCHLVLYKLEKEKLLDDEAFCEQWIRFRLGQKIGYSRIKRELKFKGIKDDMIAVSFNQLDQETALNNAVLLAGKAWKRFGTTGDIRKNRQKVIASLVRKGYDWDTARSACEAAENNAE